jgi:uncharacterized protein (DUF305 family)
MGCPTARITGRAEVAVRQSVVFAVIAALALSGCGGEGPATQAPAFNDTDVMFLQMSVEHIRQGEPVVALAEQRATDPEIKSLAAELRSQWQTEAATMTGWLAEWRQPPSAAPDAGAHAGHGDLHSLRAADVAELEATKGEDFDRTALSLLLGHLHNSVETARMETAGGSYPPAISLAAGMTTARQAQIQKMLTLIA